MKVRWMPRASRDMRRLEAELAERIVRAVVRLAEKGEGNVKRLGGTEGEHRLRVGDWRVRFVLDHGADMLVVLRVLPRREAYR